MDETNSQPQAGADDTLESEAVEKVENSVSELADTTDVPSEIIEAPEAALVAEEPENTEDVAAPAQEEVTELIGGGKKVANKAEDAGTMLKPAKEDKKSDRHWYAIHTYSGYEDRVRENLKQRIESMDMGDKIFDVLVPKEVQMEIRAGKKRKVEKKIFPGYVLVDMIVTEDSWYVVRNTPNVTGFVGFGTTPTPVSEEEVKVIQKRMGVEEPKYKIDLKAGDLVKIVDGPFKDFDATVSEVDQEKGKIWALVSMFGRETPVELDFLQVKKV